jgi:hypothetical protein
MNLTYNENMLARRALGMDRSTSVNRNRVACHVNGHDIEIAKRLAEKGAAFHYPPSDFGSMRVFVLTPEGAKAIGKKLPPALTIQPLN